MRLRLDQRSLFRLHHPRNDAVFHYPHFSLFAFFPFISLPLTPSELQTKPCRAEIQKKKKKRGKQICEKTIIPFFFFLFQSLPFCYWSLREEETSVRASSFRQRELISPVAFALLVFLLFFFFSFVFWEISQGF